MITLNFSEIIGFAFYNYLKITGKHVLSMKRIKSYAANIINCIDDEIGPVTLDMSEERINSFFINNSDIFVFLKEDSLVALSSKTDLVELQNRFCTNAAIEVIEIFNDTKNTKILLPKI